MSPAPLRRHQQVLRELSTAFSLFLRDKDCEVFFAPFDVRLLTETKQDDAIDNVVQLIYRLFAISKNSMTKVVMGHQI